MHLPADHAGIFEHQNNNLFLALLPEGEANGQVDQIARQSKANLQLTGKPLGPSIYHITLLPLGPHTCVSPELVTALGKIFAPIAACTEPFSVQFDRAGSFDVRRPKLPFALASSHKNTALLEFRKKLREPFRRLPKPTPPHVTLLWDPKNIPAHPIGEVGWIARELVLVRSYVGLSHHEHLARWPLTPQPPKLVQDSFAFPEPPTTPDDECPLAD